MGAMLTQRPELFRAIVANVGLYDALRMENDPNGVFNTTEFGTVKDKAQFEALYAYSPYHKLKKGKSYPSVLFTTGANDNRVNPAHSKKMAARMMENPKNKVLLRITFGAGHGIGSSRSQRIDLKSDTYGFLFNELGMTLK